MNDISSLNQLLPDWMLSLVGVLVIISALLLIKHFVLKRLIRLANKSQFFLDSLILTAIKTPLSLVIVCIGIFILERLPAKETEFSKAIEGSTVYVVPILLVLATVLFFDRIVAGTINHYSTKSTLLHSSRPIVKGISRSFVFGIGVLILLGTLGISITPLIASLGIGSLAVALALQPTLENFFSGVQLLVDRPIRVGDFIELDSGEQGFVEKIGWRSTWIKMLPNNTVIMPNSVLSESKIINYFYPSREMSVPVEVGVHYDSDLEQVEEVVIDVAKNLMKEHEFGVPTHDPVVLFHTFDNSSINFTVILRGQEFFHQFFLRAAFIKALHKRFKEEQIVIPYPISAINTDQENAKFMTIKDQN
ncbi:mechanosensitive ion channel family protein [Rhodanobacter aciditrophus]|uniref:Small-conductance mechanosensitive channel n=1 Tax=Rhodanobacter aciditrophus TaxID=1623218 RepID=A0ABW4B1H1_9GAMM